MNQRIAACLAVLMLGGCSSFQRERLDAPGPFDAADAGEYQLVQRDGSESELHYRLVQGEPWKFEHLLADGSWGPATCSGDCKLARSEPEQAARFMQGRVGSAQYASCQQNVAYAVCRVAGSRGARSYAFVSLTTGTPIVFELRRVEGGSSEAAP